MGGKVLIHWGENIIGDFVIGIWDQSVFATVHLLVTPSTPR
jgi:hypothetical protein